MRIDQMVRDALLIGWSTALGLALAGCPSPAVDPSGKQARSALVDAYEARLDFVADGSGPDCPHVVAAIRAEEARWAPIWSKMNTRPEPPRELVCPPDVEPGAMIVRPDGGK